MHVALTDALTCPRCGPEFGLLLLAERAENRRVLEGWLACANCRERYRVEAGYSDLTWGPPLVASEPAEPSVDEALRIAALMGVAEGPGLLMVIGPGAGNALRLSEMVEGVEVIAVSTALAGNIEQPGVSRIGMGSRIPFRTRSMRGVALTGAAARELIEEAARVAAPRSRVVVFSGGAGIAERLEESGLRIIAKDGRATVAERGLF